MMASHFIPLLLILLFACGWLFRRPLASSGGKIFARISVGLFAMTGAIAWTLLLFALAPTWQGHTGAHQCPRSVQNQPVGVESKPATLVAEVSSWVYRVVQGMFVLELIVTIVYCLAAVKLALHHHRSRLCLRLKLVDSRGMAENSQLDLSSFAFKLAVIFLCSGLTAFSQTTNTSEKSSTTSNASRVAVFVEDGFPTIGGSPSLSPFKMIEVLAQHGIEAQASSAVELSDSTYFNTERFAVLIMP